MADPNFVAARRKKCLDLCCCSLLLSHFFVRLLLYFDLIAAHTFGWSRFGAMRFGSGAMGWLGVMLFVLAVMLFGWGMVSFGNSFGVGIDSDKAGAGGLQRQISREEASLRQTYGDEYEAYAKRVRRYL